MNILEALAVVKLDNPGLPETPLDSAKISSIVVYLGVLAAVISVLVIVIAGVQMILSSGESGKIAKARTAIIYAAAGLVVSLSATTIASFVVRSST